MAAICHAWNLLCLVFFAYSGQPTTGHALLGVLFFNDLLSSTIFYPAITSNIALGNTGLWHTRWFCQLMSFGGTLTALCSSSCTCQIAIFRVFMAIHRHCPPYKIESQKKRLALSLVACSYLVSLSVPSLSYIPPDNREIDPPYGFCGLEPYKQERAIQLIKLLIWVFVPTVITSVCYWHIHGILKKMCAGNQLRSMARLRCLLIRIRWMVVLKIVAHYPIALFYLLRHDESPRPTANLIVLTIHFLSTAFNSVLYGCTDPLMEQPYRDMVEHLMATCLGRMCHRWVRFSSLLVAATSELIPLQTFKSIQPTDSDPSESEAPARPMNTCDNSYSSAFTLTEADDEESLSKF